MQIVILLSVLTLLPAIVMCLTPFLRISIVLHFLRQASPPRPHRLIRFWLDWHFS